MKWSALVLGGGGSTGEFQIGALNYLKNKFDTFNFYTGVGVGSLHSSVLAQNKKNSKGVTILQNYGVVLVEQKICSIFRFLELGYTEAEFIIIDNYPKETLFEEAKLLDSGNEIIVHRLIHN